MVRTLYLEGWRTFSVVPIFAPDCAKDESYCRLIEPMKVAFWCRTRRASRVICVGVRMLFAIYLSPNV